MTKLAPFTRRSFLGTAALGALATSPLGSLAQNTTQQAPAAPPKPNTPVPLPRTAPPYDKATINLIGQPIKGYTPQIGTLVSMLTWMQLAVLGPTRTLTQPQLDFLLDKNANTIGALMLHLAATEVLYQRITFDNEDFQKFPPDYDAKWGAAMNLGDAGRATIKGHDLAFYQNALYDARQKSLAEFAKRDDAWLLTPLKQPGWGGGPINNYCLWFHVCEHISHHAGQIDLLLSLRRRPRRLRRLTLLHPPHHKPLRLHHRHPPTPRSVNPPPPNEASAHVTYPLTAVILRRSRRTSVFRITSLQR